MFATSSDPIVSWLQGSSIEVVFDQFSTGNQIAFDLSVGVVAALFTYCLLVRLPEYERKRRIKNHLLASYASFKESTICIFLGSVDHVYAPQEAEELCKQSSFRAHFKAGYAPGQDKWDAVANSMNDFMLRQLVLETEVLLSEFQYAIGAVDIRDPEVYAFMKRLSSTLYRAKNWSSDYDGTKQVLGFFWQLLAGWSPVTGYSDHEYVVGMIHRL
ncbi:hypothetical protein [Xanthomonas prunicola]|nr:hypothetical protein [Xanthomonas prunicola]